MAERVNIREQVYQKNRGYGLQPTIQNSEYQVGDGNNHRPEMDNLSDLQMHSHEFRTDTGSIEIDRRIQMP